MSSGEPLISVSPEGHPPQYSPDVYELDLRLGKCRMAVAAKKDFVKIRDGLFG